MQKLKRGESIGPVTKAAIEGKDSDDEDDESVIKTKDEPDEGKEETSKVDEADTTGDCTTKQNLVGIFCLLRIESSRGDMCDGLVYIFTLFFR